MTRKEFAAAYQIGCTRTARFLLARGVSQDEALETAQAAWVRGWERHAQLRNVDKTLTWINSIALNLYRTHWRKDHREEEIRDFPVPAQVNLFGIDLDRMLGRCRHRDRELLVKRYYLGYEIAELARDQGCSQTALRVRLMRARKCLRRMLEPSAPLRPVDVRSLGLPGKMRHTGWFSAADFMLRLARG